MLRAICWPVGLGKMVRVPAGPSDIFSRWRFLSLLVLWWWGRGRRWAGLRLRGAW
jgi:hypothetical protein